MLTRFLASLSAGMLFMGPLVSVAATKHNQLVGRWRSDTAETGYYQEAFDGMLEWRDGVFHIYCNLSTVENSTSVRARFTLAHELGHFFIDEHRNALASGRVPAHPSFCNNANPEVQVEAEAKRLHTISGLKKPTGVAFLADLNLLVVASGDDGTCRFYDGTSYEEKGRITNVDDADNVRFDAKAKRVCLGYGEGALGVIDPIAMKLTASIPLAKHPESFQLEQDGPRIFVNVPDAKQVAVVDRAAGKVITTWPVNDFHANFPMALDEAEHRLFIGCRTPARLLAFDTESGKRVADTPLSGDIDDLFFDAATNRLLGSCGEGFIDVFHFEAPAKLERTHKLASAAGARTSRFDAKLGFFLAVPHRGAQGAEIREYRAR
jgi:hypothetical protein